MNSFRSNSLLRLRSALLFTLLVPFAGVAYAESAPSGGDGSMVPIVSTDEIVQKELLNLDKLLETNPKLEEALRANLDQITQDAMQMKDPDVAAFLKSHPGVAPALKKERHFLLHRAIARIAKGPLFRADLVQLDQFLAAHPDIQKPLDNRPRMITDANFLIAHPALATFLDNHPGLSTVLMEQAGKGKKAGGKAAPAQK